MNGLDLQYRIRYCKFYGFGTCNVCSQSEPKDEICGSIFDYRLHVVPMFLLSVEEVSNTTVLRIVDERIYLLREAIYSIFNR